VTRSRGLAPLAVAGLLLAGTTPPAATQSPTSPWSEFPSYDRQVSSLLATGATAKRARRQLEVAPAAPETIGLLLEAHRVDDAIRMLPDALAGSPDQVVAAVRAITNSSSILMDDTRGYRETLRRLVEPVRARVTAMAREDGARVALAMMSFDNWAERGGSRNWRARQTSFVTQYAGTETAKLVEVDMLSSDAPRARSLEPLEQFWRNHPGTTVGAKALYQIGFQLHTINMMEPRGGDPTDRLLRVAEVVRELESGRYPKSEWVEQAPSLMIGFFVSSSPPGPTYAAGNVERSLAAYESFVMAHVARIGPDVDNELGYLIASKMANLYELQGDRIGGVEGLLVRLEAKSSQPETVRLLRGSFYMRQWTAGPDAMRATAGERARAAFEGVAAEGRGATSRTALASLAAMAYYERDYTRAIPLYRRYVDTFPDSAFAWVALLRLGQCYEAQLDWARAAETYERAAKTYASGPAPGSVLANTYAGRSHDALGDPVRALTSYRRAVAAWDPDYGERYDFYASQQRPASATPALAVDRSSVTKSQLTDRVDTLARVLALPGGDLLERGRWQLGQRRFVDARASMSQLLERHPKSPLVVEARALSHLAQLEQAISLADIEAAQHDDAAAMTLLDGLANETPDVAVGLADLAAGTLLYKQGVAERADARMRGGLTRLAALVAPVRGVSPMSPIDADITAIRALVFRPAGDLALLAKGWNAFTFPASLPPFVIVRPDVSVKLASGETTIRTVYQRFADMPNAVFLNSEEIEVLSRLLYAAGGTRTREPRQVMETPHQPAGAAVDILAFWNRFFPARGGHWGGWVLETYPIITRIEFLDAARTKANALVTVGYSGGTLVLEKTDGVWKVIRLTNQWIT
jgi:tetratricopeptide (TPR) repeat protein